MRITISYPLLKYQSVFNFGFIALLVSLLILRRPDHVFHPYVWDEDGTRNIPEYLSLGWQTLFHPVNGYLIFIPKLINFLSLKISFYYYPEVSSVLGFLFNLLVLVSIWKAPTYLVGRGFCAVAVLLIPHGAETYILPLYTFWPASLLIVLVLLWHKDEFSLWLQAVRFSWVLLGGLSSPLTITLTPLFIGRLIIMKPLMTTNKVAWWGDFIITLLAISISIAQVSVMTITNPGGTDIFFNNLQAAFSIEGIKLIAAKFFSFYFFYHLLGSPLIFICFSIVALIILMGMVWRNRLNLGLPFYLLVFLYAISVANSLLRVPVQIVDPFFAGPRYFYYPYIFLSWILIQLLFQKDKMTQVATAILLILAIHTSSFAFIRTSERLDWQFYVKQCFMAKDKTRIPIHYDGTIVRAWAIDMTPQDCKQLVNKSLVSGFNAN